MMSSMHVYNLHPRSPVVLPVTNAGLLHVELISSQSNTTGFVVLERSFVAGARDIANSCPNDLLPPSHHPIPSQAFLTRN